MIDEYFVFVWKRIIFSRFSSMIPRAFPLISNTITSIDRWILCVRLKTNHFFPFLINDSARVSSNLKEVKFAVHFWYNHLFPFFCLFRRHWRVGRRMWTRYFLTSIACKQTGYWTGLDFWTSGFSYQKNRKVTIYRLSLIP